MSDSSASNERRRARRRAETAPEPTSASPGRSSSVNCSNRRRAGLHPLRAVLGLGQRGPEIRQIACDLPERVAHPGLRLRGVRPDLDDLLAGAERVDLGGQPRLDQRQQRLLLRQRPQLRLQGVHLLGGAPAQLAVEALRCRGAARDLLLPPRQPAPAIADLRLEALTRRGDAGAGGADLVQELLLPVEHAGEGGARVVGRGQQCMHPARRLPREVASHLHDDLLRNPSGHARGANGRNPCASSSARRRRWMRQKYAPRPPTAARLINRAASCFS